MARNNPKMEHQWDDWCYEEAKALELAPTGRNTPEWGTFNRCPRECNPGPCTPVEENIRVFGRIAVVTTLAVCRGVLTLPSTCN